MKVVLDASLFDNPQLSRLCELLGCERTTAVGALALLWHQSRSVGFVAGGSAALMPLLPVEPGRRIAYLRALIETGFVTVQGNSYEVTGNAEHQALIEKRRAAGRCGGRKPWPKPEPAPKRKRKVASPSARPALVKAPPKAPPTTEFQTAKRLAWEAYHEAYLQRWSVEPLRNAKVNACIQTFVQRVGYSDAPHVLRFYLEHNDRTYIRSHHAITDAVRDAESLHAQWRRNEPITTLQCAMAEKANMTLSQADRVQRGLL